MTCDHGDSVAVVIAAYDAAAFIGRAIRSALAERETTEVIVVDDASSDGTLQAAFESDDGTGRLIVLRQPVNLGPGAARNRGMSVAASAWIAILDADDYLLPGRLAALLRHAGHADLVADDPLMELNGDPGGRRERVLGVDSPLRLTFSAFVHGNVSRGGRAHREWGYLQPLIRRTFIREHGLAHQEHLRLGEDYELYARALAHGARFTVIPAAGYVCVRRDGSLSVRHAIADLVNLRDCDAVLAAFPGLTADDRQALRHHEISIECRIRWRMFLNAAAGGRLIAAAACFVGPWPVPWHMQRLCLWRTLRACGFTQAGASRRRG